MKLAIHFEKIRRLRFITDPRIGFWGRFTFIFGVPLIITWLMFDPFTRITLKTNTNEPQFVSRTQINDNLTSSFLAEFFQTSLQLGWYKICFENHGALEMGGRTIINREDRGDVQIQVREVIPIPFNVEYSRLSARPFENTDCIRIGSGVEGINVGSSTLNLGARINDRPGDFVMHGENEFSMDFLFDFTKMDLYIRQDWTAFGVKYLVMVVLWASFTLLAQSIWNFLRTNRA